jgi:hypothetical protein
MLADNLIADGDRSDIIVIFDDDDIGWADIGAGPTSNAQTLKGHDIIQAVSFFHFKGTGTDNFFANPNT